VLLAPLVEAQGVVEAGKRKAPGVASVERSALYAAIPAIAAVLPDYAVAL
jgi:hypothetical protein